MLIQLAVTVGKSGQPWGSRRENAQLKSRGVTRIPPKVRHVVKRFPFILLLVTNTFLASCVSVGITPYPHDWSPLVKSSEAVCPDLSGRYHPEESTGPEACTGSCFRMALDQAFFDWAKTDFAGDEEAVAVEPDHETATPEIELRQAGQSTLELISRASKDRSTRRSLKNIPSGDWAIYGPLGGEEKVSGFGCSAHGLRMRQRFLAFFALAALWQDNARDFQKTQNGDLVMRQSSDGFGYFLLLPVMDHTVHWHRWRAIP